MNILNKIKSKRPPVAPNPQPQQPPKAPPPILDVSEPSSVRNVEPPDLEESQFSRPPSNQMLKKEPSLSRVRDQQNQPQEPPRPVLFRSSLSKPANPNQSKQLRKSASNRKGPPSNDLVNECLTREQRSGKGNFLGTVLSCQQLMDINLLKLLNYDGRVLYLNVPDADLQDIDDLQYICVKGAATYSADGKDYAVATKRQIMRTILREQYN